MLVGLAAIVVLLAGVLAVGHYHRAGPAPNPSRPPDLPSEKSVAVLPFDNFSAERDTDYLSDGLTEEITAALARVPGLRVVSRNSAFMFKGKATDPRKVGEALHVATLLEGSLRKVGDQIRVSAQLINVADGFHLWSETYDRPVGDIIAVQEEIAGRIAERLQGGDAPSKRPPVDPEAHTLYLQGKLFWNKRTEAGLRKAIELYRQAIEKDPTYADAHGALASSYMLLPQYAEGLSLNQYRPLARAAANRALELDPDCAEAHAVLGMLLNHDFKDKESEEHFRHAIRVAPNYATAHHWYGLCLEYGGRNQQALTELHKALELDPLSPIIHSTIPEWFFLNRDYDRAIAEARAVIDTFPEFPPARPTLIMPLVQKGQFQEALAEIDKARALQPDQPLALVHIKGFCLARLGRDAEARQIVAQLEEQRRNGKHVEELLAMVYQGLRDWDKALDMAELICVNEGFDREVLYNPVLDEVRSMPRFQSLLKRAGLTNAPGT
jgi:TolB-like protein/tetratricopeptide (TPR) repeat protein